jgi:DNA polymerase III subunit delta'
MADTGQGICFTDLLGQEKAKKFMLRTLASGRLPHAFLFKGPEGVGKQLFARGLAAAMNCRAEGRIGACGACVSCRKFRSGNHPDFMVISPEKGAIKIEQVRQMCQALSYPPYESDTRVVLLEDVHTMRAEAANSLLKTLEEPPADNLLILTADSSREILPTIASRCQVVPFHALSMQDTARILEGLPGHPDPDASRLLARLSEGSPGRAKMFLKTEMVETLKKVISVIADPETDGDRNLGVLLRTADMMAELKENLPPFLGLLKLWLRDQLMLANGLPERCGPEAMDMAGNSGRRKPQSATQIFSRLRAVRSAEKQLVRNCNRSLVCEVLLFKL